MEEKAIVFKKVRNSAANLECYMCEEIFEKGEHCIQCKCKEWSINICLSCAGGISDARKVMIKE